MVEAVLLGIVSALSWSVHDLIARSFADRMGPFRLAVRAMVLGGLLLTPYVLWQGTAFAAGTEGVLMSMALGLAYGVGIGTIYKAFAMGPVSVVAPLTAAYPVIVVIWGLFNGLSPTPVQWLAVASAMLGALVIARSGHADGGINAVARDKLPLFLVVCAFCLLGFASAFIIGQRAAVIVGEFEAAWMSRLTGTLAILPFVLTESKPRRLEPKLWFAVLGCALFDVIGLVAMNASGHFPGREFAAVGISSYGAIAVVLAAMILKEKVSAGQWSGIALIVAGVLILSLSG